MVPGLIRFNGVGDFRPQFPNRVIGEIFECTDLAFACGGNRVLFVKKIHSCTPPDYLLVAISSEIFGRFSFDSPSWKSKSVLPIAVSQMGERQEALLLMKRDDWVKSSLGIWRFGAADSNRRGVSLELFEHSAISE